MRSTPRSSRHRSPLMATLRASLAALACLGLIAGSASAQEDAGAAVQENAGATVQENAGATVQANLDQATLTVHGLAMHGEAKYGPDFAHVDYVNPDAPKGGRLVLSSFGGFDSLNPFIESGNPAPGLGLTVDTLLVSTDDEAFTEYGLIAETVTVPEDRSWVAFDIRPEARFHDGTPVTPEDVIWSMDILKAEGAPHYRFYYANVVRGEPVGERGVRFVFDVAGNRELPLIVGQLPVLSKAAWEGRDFGRVTIYPFLGNGPYRVASFNANQTLRLERVEDYWAADLPIRRGMNNFDEILYLGFRDRDVERQALFSGDIDLFQENTAKDWAVTYQTSPAVRDGLILKEEIPHEIPQGMQGFFFNMRRAKFQDIRVRQAIDLMFDWQAVNEEVAYGAYTRSTSFFSNSELASSGLPSDAELALLEPLREQIPDAVFTEPFEVAGALDARAQRERLRQANQLLIDAGWVVQDGKRVSQTSGETLSIEFLNVQAGMTGWINPLRRNLERLGIETSVRTVDVALYLNRLRDFDFDMIVSGVGQSLSPGNEQRDFWGSQSAEEPGSRNFSGLKSPAVDQLITHIIQAEDREALITATHALDRVLLHSHILVPMHHISQHRVAHWDVFGRPETPPRYALGLMTWWEIPGRRATVNP